MKRFLSNVLMLIALGAMIYTFRDQLQAAIHNIFYVPCSAPIAYSLGSFDARFGISKDYFLSAVKDAEAIWEKPIGKDLFIYQANGALKLNLVFDERELTTTKLAGIDSTLKNDQASYDILKARYASLKDHYAQLKTDYDTRVDAFNQHRGPYDRQEAASLQALQVEINGIVRDLNETVDQLNKLANTLNLNVDKYNTIGASRGDSFEQGIYESDGVHQKIDIYEFSDRTKLVRLLAHELGHAIGLDHVADKQAIMYELNEGAKLSATTADLSAMKTLCGIK